MGIDTILLFALGVIGKVFVEVQKQNLSMSEKETLKGQFNDIVVYLLAAVGSFFVMLFVVPDHIELNPKMAIVIGYVLIMIVFAGILIECQRRLRKLQINLKYRKTALWGSSIAFVGVLTATLISLNRLLEKL